MTLPVNQIVCGDCREVVDKWPTDCIDAIVTDPPYGLSFMGKDWDHGVPGPIFWQKLLRVAKPGCWLLAFGGTRTHHRLACAIEDAGWEIRDCIMWTYGSGFPKSYDIGKAIDKASGVERKVIAEYKTHDIRKAGLMDRKGPLTVKQTVPTTDAAKQWDGWGTALKPAWEPIIVARKPVEGTVIANVLKYGTGGLNIDRCRIETEDNLNGGAYSPNKQNDKQWGTMHRAVPGAEYIQPAGRWPANFIHDGSEEVVELFPETTSKAAPRGGQGFHNCLGRPNRPRLDGEIIKGHTDSGSAARFFYCAKASRSERETNLIGKIPCVKCGRRSTEYHVDPKTSKQVQCCRNNHPTVKPLSLMRYLCQLIASPNSIVLDPFCGSGTTCVAAREKGFRFVGIDDNPQYVRIAKAKSESDGEIYDSQSEV